MEILITGILIFASTNVDDIFILSLFYGNNRFKESEVVIGQYLGIITLITLSLVLSLIGFFIEKPFIGLLGFIPIYLGLKGFLNLSDKSENSTEPIALKENNSQNKSLIVAGVTIANGGDNIGIYTPLFATLALPDKAVMVTIFLMMTGLWCYMAKVITRHPYVSKSLAKYGHMVMPFIFILLGIYIFYENESIRLFDKIS